MKLKDIAEPPKGTYMATKLDDQSRDRVKKLCLALGVQNRVPSDKLHTTIIYSRKHAPDIEVREDIYPLEATPFELTIFRTQDDKNALVLKLNCTELVDRHNYIMETHETTYDHPEYVPHITISYNCGDFDPASYKGQLPNITYISEYVEDLVLDWQNKDK